MKGRVKDAINATIGLLAANGWQIEKATDYIVQAAHICDNKWGFLWSSEFDLYRSWYRLIFTFVQESNGVRIYGVLQILTNRGTGFEMVMDLDSQKAYEATQKWLEAIRNRIQLGR
ncbi:MAG: hypothetical protein ACK4F0_06860 [Candidatus Ratteibacteria bacterium]